MEREGSVVVEQPKENEVEKKKSGRMSLMGISALNDDELEDEEESLDSSFEETTLAEQINEEQLQILHQRFLNAPKNRMSVLELKQALEEVLGKKFNEEKFGVLFLKLNSKRDGFANWDEIVSHLLLEYQEKYIDSVQVNLDTPLEDVPRVIKSHHRHPITKITFYPAIYADRTIDYLRGNYMTCSSDGSVNFWNLDMEHDRTVIADSAFLKVSPTWVTDMVCLPDVSIICVSSTERDLRFYDITAKKWELRVVISSLEHAVVCMHYYFSKKITEDSRIVCGDTGGNVRIYSFNSYEKGPFYHKPGIDVRYVLYDRVLKGDLQSMKIIEFRNIHQDWVKQVSYYGAINAFVSCAVCPENSLYMCDALGSTTKYIFNVAKGVSCFYIEENCHLIATGGPDCIVRLWSAFVQTKATCVLQGHHTSIVAVIIQKDGQRLVSISKDRCVKIWDVAFQNCIQTYTQIPASVGEHTALCVYYNVYNHVILIGCMQIAIVTCGKLISEDTTDGVTHLREITYALYNPLFKIVVSVGLGSMIMVWNPFKGKRKMLKQSAHVKMMHGELQPVEITAATFDPSYQLLLTGARDGTLKIWNFNTATCIRNMSIEKNCEVSSVIWLTNRILAIGWNRHVVEFSDTGKITKGKSWETRHTSDVLCAAYRTPQCVATSSYSGELILWRLETGQPYRKYHVADPTGTYKLSYIREKVSKKPKSIASSAASTSASASVKSRSSINSIASGSSVSSSESARKAKAKASMPLRYARRKSLTLGQHDNRVRKVSEVSLPPSSTMRPLAVHAMCFLPTRPMQPDTGTLLLSLESGQIQVWSHHSAGGFMSSFFAIHTVGDYVLTMAMDPEDKYLFTGTTVGYIKVWLMENYCLPYPVKICMPLIRLQFPFLWQDRIDGRAKRSNRNQPLPMLLNSYRGHTTAVQGLAYVDTSKILISCSTDFTVRFWALDGRYINTLGTFRPWTAIPQGKAIGPDYPYRIPPDIKRVASYTTMKVLRGGMKWWEKKKKEEVEEKQEFTPEERSKYMYGKPLTAPILGNFFKMPERPVPPARLPTLDRSMARIPVYCHLSLSEELDVPRPYTPDLVVERRMRKKQTPTHSRPSQMSMKSTRKQSTITFRTLPGSTESHR